MRTIHFYIIILAAAVMLLALAQPACAVNAMGGDTTNVIDGYRIHTFTNSAEAANFLVTVGGAVDVLVVAGGGGGGDCIAGGGGAGGLIYTSACSLAAGTYTVTVGDGGLGAVSSSTKGMTGQHSVFDSLIAYGGGGGGGWDSAVGNNGGSGGGNGGQGAAAASVGVSGQGNAGGITSGNGNGGSGGGGAGSVGTNGIGALAGRGGMGKEYDISGVSTYYAGGGGGGARSVSASANIGGTGGGGGGSIANIGTNGTANTGGGGGGGGYNGTYWPGGKGGSGIVIVRYLLGVDNADGATNIASTSAWLNGKLYDSGETDKTIMVFWGPTDGGTNASGWANTNTWAAPQTPGAFTVQATGLAPGSTYYYRFAASNTAGWAWASEASIFSTGEIWINKTADASEIGPTPGTFTVHRAASTTNEALNMTYTVSGTAIPDVDYTALSGTLTIPKGAQTATIEVMPIFDHFLEVPETVIVTLTSGPYVIGSPSNATVNITDAGLFTRTWGGGGANELASTAANWVEGEAPIAGDAILLDNRTGKAMTWDLNLPIQTWTQSGYTGTVTIATIYGGTGFTNLNIAGDCTINNGVWTHIGPQNSEVYRLSATISGKLTIGPNASVNVTSKGYGAGRGPGYDGSYGGRGTISGGGPCYGSIIAPTNLGSGSYAGSGIPGGGAIRLTVFGEMRNDGLVCADGNGWWCGAGGSIWITSGTLVGTGAIRANGGLRNGGGGGGGGRISLVVKNAGADFTLYSGLIRAIGGGAGAGAGTVYLCTAAQGRNEGTLIIDNNGITGNATEINPNVSDTVVGDVFIRNNGYLVVNTNQALTLSGIWSNGARFEAQSGSRIVIAGKSASTSIVYGNNTFSGLMCTNANGKRILFEAGKTNTITNQGRLILKGSAESNLILRSTSDGASWKLNLTPGSVDQSLLYVDVKNSDALPGVGEPVIALNSMDSGANPNWVFMSASSGETNIWTGNSSTAWSLVANWNLGRSPIDDDFILIPSNCPRYPVLDNQDRTVNGLAIQSGASLSLAGYNLTVRKPATTAGELIASATETITFQANADFADGSFTAASSKIACEKDVNFAGCSFSPGNSTIVLSGNTPQSMNPGNLTFYKINVLNTSTVAFVNGFSAIELRCEAIAGTRRLSFQQDETVALRDLILPGSPAFPNIVLRSSASGQKWKLAVSGYRFVQGVDVQDCDASPGVSITATSSRDTGGNLHWIFDAFSVWLGTSGTDFNIAANWSPVGVPGANTPILVDVANPMVINSAVKVLDLTVGGGAGVASVKANALLSVVENIVVLTNGTLALNQPCVVKNGFYVMAGGTLTHDGPQNSEVNKLNVTVGGNMSVDANASVNVSSKGYGSLSPGYIGGHGGRSSTGGPCYGSIAAPTNLGSGGVNGGGIPGGGAIRFDIFGEMRNNGLIFANGGGGPQFGAGGSIWITAGTLIGTGVIRANGGTGNGNFGGGGRISLVVTKAGADFSGFTGSVMAFGGGAGAGAGTIYRRRTAGNRRHHSTVLVDNNGNKGYTDVPPGPPNVTNEVDFIPFHVANAAILRLTNNFTLGDIHLLSTNACLDLGSNTLTVRSREHSLEPGFVANYGAIIWWPHVPKGTIYFAK